MINAQIIADSVNIETGDRLTTFVLLRFPKCLVAELNTHRQLSRNSESSRAIPVKKRIEKINKDPYIPSFTLNQKGMIGAEIDLESKEIAESYWFAAMGSAISNAEWLSNSGIHKDMANRLLEPFSRVPVIVSATEWDNFFKLRTASDCNPDFRQVAIAMQELRNQSKPRELDLGEWHIPYDFDSCHLEDRLGVSAARCARISYSTHDGEFSPRKDILLCDRLIREGHLSPLEHQAKAIHSIDSVNTHNLKGFQSYRALVELGEMT